MLSLWEMFFYLQIYGSFISINMFPVGELSIDSSGGSSPVEAETPAPEMSASDMLTLIRADKGLQINLLAMVSVVLIGFQVLLGSWRRRSGNKIVVNLLRGAYTISFPVFVYTIGQIQSVEAAQQLDSQLLWAVGLLLLLGSVNGMSAFSRNEVEDSKGMQAQHIVKTVLLLWLLVSRSDVSEGGWILLLYFLLCWVYSILRVAQRMKALRKASSVHGLVRSAKVVADYMEDIYASNDVIHDPSDMSKCKYLVLGEEKDSSPPSKAPYLAKVGSKGKIVTFDMIWNSKSKLLSPNDAQTRALKDTCLSFALFKMLKRRFCRLHIAEKGKPEALEFVLAKGEHAFHLVEIELSFLYDFFYTKYPALFPAAPVLRVVRFFVLLGLFKVLLVDFVSEAISQYNDNLPAESLEAFTGYSFKQAVVFILFNNILVVFMILSIDILQDVVTGYSNWAIVHYVCDYVRRSEGDGSKGWWMTVKRCWERGFGIRRALIKWVAARRHREKKTTHLWDNKLGQYSLLNSCGYTANTTNAFSLLTLRLVEKTGEGRKREKDVILTDQIKKAVLCSLRESRGRLSVGRSLELRDKLLRLHWAPFDLPTSTHMVLVWHIATTICANQDQGTYNSDTSKCANQDQGTYNSDTSKCADQDQGTYNSDTSKCADQDQGTYNSATSTCADQDQGTYNSHMLLSRLIATTLSGYCAYLLAFVPDMLPDHSYKARQILDAVILDARQHVGKIKGLPDRCSELLKLKAPDMSDKVQDMSILILGANLASELMLVGKRPPWELLAGFWADLVLFLAPSDKPDVHADCLATGGEFMTHLWALLTHTGIVDRPDIHAASHA